MRLPLVVVFLGAVACGGGGSGSGGNNTPGDTDAGGDPGPTTGDTDPGGDSAMPTACSLTLTCGVTRSFVCTAGIGVYTSGPEAGTAIAAVTIPPDDTEDPSDQITLYAYWQKAGTTADAFIHVGGYGPGDFDSTVITIGHGVHQCDVAARLAFRP